MKTRKKWNNHLKDNNTTYIKHMFFAIGCAAQTIFAGLCLIVHSLLPCFFEKTGSKIIIELAEKFKNR